MSIKFDGREFESADDLYLYGFANGKKAAAWNTRHVGACHDTGRTVEDVLREFAEQCTADRIDWDVKGDAETVARDADELRGMMGGRATTTSCTS